MVTNIQPGDALGIYNTFNIMDENTYISWLVRMGINIGNENGGYCKYQHIGSIIKKDGVLCIGEAIEPKYHIIPLEEKLKGRNLNDFIIYRPNYEYDLGLFTKAILSFEGKRYDLVDLFAEAIREATHHRVWLGSEGQEKIVFCSESDSTARKISTHNKLFTDCFERDPKDYWVDELFDKIPVKLI